MWWYFGGILLFLLVMSVAHALLPKDKTPTLEDRVSRLEAQVESLLRGGAVVSSLDS